MLEPLIPICLVWALAAVYLAGWDREVTGGGAVQQVLGLVITIALFETVWFGLHFALRGMGFLGGALIPTAVGALAFPLLANVGFRILGMRVVKAEAHH